jgi:hypothetical protein
MATLLLDRVQVNVIKVLSRPCTDDRILMAQPILCKKPQLSSIELHIERMKIKGEDVSYYLLIVNLLILHGSCSSMYFQVIFWRNWDKGNKDACKI